MRAEVVLVDNASTDGSPEYLRRQFPWAKLLVNDRNLGFAGGNNIGIRYALEHGADTLWLLNNDTEIAPDCIAELMMAANEHIEYGLFGCKIYYYDQPRLLWYTGGHVRLNLPMGATHGRMNSFDDHAFDSQKEISFVTGCALMIRREVIETIGLLDESMFAYAEDLDWCIKAQRAGFRALYVPSAKVWHKIGKSLDSQSGRALQTYLCTRNRFVVQKRYSSALEVLWLIPKYLGCNVARRAYRAILGYDMQQVVALWWGILDGIRGSPLRCPSMRKSSSIEH